MATEASWAGFRRMEGVQPLVETPVTSGREWSPWRPWLRKADVNGRQWEFRRVSNRLIGLVFYLTGFISSALRWSIWADVTVGVTLFAFAFVGQRFGLHRLRDK